MERKEILNLYKEIIKNYSKLNEMLDLRNPVQIQILFDILVKKGYLSYDKKLNVATNPKNIRRVDANNVINGKCLDKDLAIMLNDILNECGCSSVNLSVDRPNSSFEIIESVGKIQSMDEINEMLKHLTDSEREYIKKALNDSHSACSNPYLRPSKTKFDPRKFIYGDDIITITSYNDKCYMLDPCKGLILKPDKRKYELSENGDLIPKYISSRILFGTTMKDVKDILSHPYSKDIDDYKDMRNVSNLYLNNLNLFNEFYKKNEPNYNEIAEIKRR